MSAPTFPAPVSGEVIAAVYSPSGWTTSLEEHLAKLAGEAERDEQPIGAEMLRMVAAGQLRTVASVRLRKATAQ